MIDIPKQAVLFTMAYSGAMDEKEIIPEDIPEFKNIYMKNIVCQGCGQAIQVDGLKQLPIHDLYFENVNIVARQGIRCQMAEDIHLKDVTITKENDSSIVVHFDDETVGEGFEAMISM